MNDPVCPPAPPPEVKLGIYEKALRWSDDWDALFADAHQAGFSFVDISIDETPERRARLDWSLEERAHVRAAATRHGVQLGGVCLSVIAGSAPALQTLRSGPRPIKSSARASRCAVI